ncbi:hypothetical protein GE061_005736 [Apolygus lucorum]|uniref:Uncharacterized protein n=1 Tax=Apolygus lucorum TaxID=248454 RepID=A0A6A4ISS5_APOLU|nr:hypothetical protein GE061_005736 [Apolygus lucorum]
MAVTAQDGAGDFSCNHPYKEAGIYIKNCEQNQSPVQSNVVQALETASVIGELCLAGQALSSTTVAGLAASLRNSSGVHVVNLADCMVSPAALVGFLDAFTSTAALRNLNLHGNNIGSQVTAKLGKLLAVNTSIKTLVLKWNNLGISIDAFSIFCNGLSQNSCLDELDLRSNQLCMDCAKHLGSAIRSNTNLKSLDLRWNNIHNEGAEALLRGLEENRSLSSLQIQGNCIHREIALAIDECIKNHATIVKANSDYDIKTNILLDRIRVLEESRSQQVNEIKERMTTQLGEAEKRLGILSRENQEKETRIEELENKLFVKEEERKIIIQRSSVLEQNLKDREKSHKEFQTMHQRSLNKLQQEVKEEENEQKAKLKYLEEQMMENQKVKEESQDLLAQQIKENKSLKDELSRLKTQHGIQITQMEETFETQKKSWKNKWEDMERSHEDQIHRLKSSAFEIQQELEAKISELGEKQSRKLLSLTETCERVKQDKNSLEERISSLQNTTSQLQRENSNLIAQVAEPARKLTSLMDELSNEKVLNQRMKQEKMEAIKIQEDLTKELENMKSRLILQKTELEQSEKSHEEQTKSLKNKLKQLQSKLDDKNKKIESLKSDERARTKFLQSAFSKYFDKYHSLQSPSSKSSDS